MMPRENLFSNYDVVESTQDTARVWLRKIVSPPDDSKIFWVRADHQTAGRGRAGRRWLNNEAGSALLVSAAFYFSSVGANVSLLPLLAGWIFFKTVAECVPANAHSLLLKWPNDLGIFEHSQFRKLGGVLCESPFRGAYVIGWGANTLQAPNTIESTLSLQELVGAESKAPEAEAITQILAESFRLALMEWSAAPRAFEESLLQKISSGPMQALWGRRGRLESGESATAKSLADDGALIVEIDAQKTIKKVYAGDFSFSR